jgi:hypothetical protein
LEERRARLRLETEVAEIRKINEEISSRLALSNHLLQHDDSATKQK